MRVYPKINGMRKPLKSSHRSEIAKESSSMNSSPKSDSYLSEDVKSKAFVPAPSPVISNNEIFEESEINEDANEQDIDTTSHISKQYIPKKSCSVRSNIRNNA